MKILQSQVKDEAQLKTQLIIKKISETTKNELNTKANNYNKTLSFKDRHIIIFANSIIKSADHICLHYETVKAIATQDEEFIRREISFKNFINIDLVFCPIKIRDQEWTLLIFDNKMRKSYFLHSDISDIIKLNYIGQIITDNLNSFYRNKDITIYTTYNETYQQKCIRCDSGFLICGYMMKSLYKRSLETINITELKSAISTLDIYSPENPKLITNKANRIDITLKERIKNSENINTSNKDTNCNDFENIITNYIWSIRRIKKKEINRSRSTKPRENRDEHLRLLFKHSPKAAFQIIKENIETNDNPSEIELITYYKNKSEIDKTTDWTVPQYIKKVENFEFKTINSQSVLHQLKNMKKSVP